MNAMDGQRGVALLTALLVVALATVAAASMASRLSLSMRRTASLLGTEQARAYALGVERWSRAILRRDARDGDVDSLDEIWARHLPPLQVTGGEIRGGLEDLQGRFNLNGLLRQGKVDAAARARFERLLRVLQIDPALVQAVLDWLDADIDPRFPDGAEDDAYLLLQPAYRAGNRPLVSVSELRLVKGMDHGTWTRLAPYVVALPEPTRINVNTAPAPVLRALVPGLSADEAQRIVEQRKSKRFESAADFLQLPVLAGRRVDAAEVGVGSDYFLLRARVTVGSGRTTLYSIIHRHKQAVETLRRSFGTW